MHLSSEMHAKCNCIVAKLELFMGGVCPDGIKYHMFSYHQTAPWKSYQFKTCVVQGWDCQLADCHSSTTQKLVKDCQWQKPSLSHRSRTDLVAEVAPSPGLGSLCLSMTVASSRDPALPGMTGAGTPSLGSAGNMAGMAWALGIAVA